MKFNEYVQINEGLTVKEIEAKRVETAKRKASEKQFKVVFKDTKEVNIVCESDLLHLISHKANIIFAEC